MTSVRVRVLCGVVFVLFTIAVGHAQIRGVTATLTPLVERDSVAGGQTIRAALQVALPEGFHVQSNEPRDPTLIPTVLTINPPEGVTVTEIVFPTPAKRERKPVLIDMWATWCKNCLTMDVTTMKEPEVVAALNGYVKIKFQAEDPDREPARAVMQRFGAVGLPTYVILRPKVRQD